MAWFILTSPVTEFMPSSYSMSRMSVSPVHGTLQPVLLGVDNSKDVLLRGERVCETYLGSSGCTPQDAITRGQSEKVGHS